MNKLRIIPKLLLYPVAFIIITPVEIFTWRAWRKECHVPNYFIFFWHRNFLSVEDQPGYPPRCPKCHTGELYCSLYSWNCRTMMKDKCNSCDYEHQYPYESPDA